MANTDETFDGAALAVGVQSAFGTPNATIAALAGSIAATDGCVLGDKASGDADSGISLPTIEQIAREVADVPGSFTASADSFQKANVTGFSITIPIQGNGDTADNPPSAGDAALSVLHPGIHAILTTLGLIAANGTAPVVAYTPRHAGSAGGPTIYSTWKVWHGDLSLVFSDCLIESASIVFTPGGNALMTCNVLVGTFDPATGLADGVTFPTINYGTQASLAAPVVAGVNFTWGQVHSFETLTINIENTIAEFGASNVAVTGIRKVQTARRVSVQGTIYVETADSDFHIQQLLSAVAPTADLSFQIGTPAVALATINAAKFEVNNLQPKSLKYNRRGTALVVELGNSKATATVAGGEFTLTYN